METLDWSRKPHALYQIQLHERPTSEPPILGYEVFSEALEETSKLLGDTVPAELKTSILDALIERSLTIKYVRWVEDASEQAT